MQDTGKFQRPTIAGKGIFLLALLLFACQENKKAEQVREDIQLDTVWVQEPILKYGIPVDSFIIEEGVVKPNQYLGQILNGKGVSMAVIDKIAKLSKKVFDVRKIKSGKNYTFFLTPDSLRTPRYFVYENSPVEYVVYQLYDSLAVRPGEKDIQTRLCTAQGVVESSLWNTVIDNDLHPVLTVICYLIFFWFANLTKQFEWLTNKPLTGIIFFQFFRVYFFSFNLIFFLKSFGNFNINSVRQTGFYIPALKFIFFFVYL